MKPRFLRMLAAPLLAALCLTLAGPAAGQPAPYVIHVILPLTGPGASLGQDEANSLAAFEKYANRTGGLRGTPIHFQVSDDQTQPAVAVQLLNQIIQTHPSVVLGSALAAQTQAMSAIVASNGPLLYALTPNIIPAAHSYVFATSAETRDLSGVALPYFRARGLTKVATFVTNDASGQNNLESVMAAAALPENKSITFVDKETQNLNDLNVNAQAAKIKASGAQAVFALQNGTLFGTALHAMADVGLDIPVYTSAANFSPQLLDQYKGFLPKELIASGPSYFNRDRPANDPLKKPIDDFYAALAGENIRVPVVTHAFAWDPALIVLSALRQLGPTATPAQLRDYIEKLKHFPGVQGMYDFSPTDHHGLGISGLLILRSDPNNPGHALVVSKGGGIPL